MSKKSKTLNVKCKIEGCERNAKGYQMLFMPEHPLAMKNGEGKGVGSVSKENAGVVVTIEEV